MEYGLIGEHLGHSFSKDIHEKLSDRPYELREMTRDGLANFLSDREFKGINVTIPYKEAVLPFLDFVSEEARKIGAVNTIVNREGKLWGYNTDYFGFQALADRAGVCFEGRSILILGAGGAAKTVAAVVRDQGASSVTHAVRCPKTSGQLALAELQAGAPFEIVVNCTPAGMFPHDEERITDLKAFPKLKGALDLIYNPLRTEFILDAEALGVPAEGGLYMLVAQAVKAREFFDGVSCQTGNAVQTCYNNLLNAKRNLVLIGMPSSGKSTIGRALAEKTGRPFVDTDSLISARAGKSIPQIFAEEGETAFRELEAGVIRELSPRTGLIIATGGGAILNGQNVRRLRRNGLLCFIRRDLALLNATPDRPLSSDTEALRALYERRKDAYRQATDRVIDNDCPLGNTLRQFDALI